MITDDVLLEGALRVLFLPSDDVLRRRLDAAAAVPMPQHRRRALVIATLVALAAAIPVMATLWRDVPSFWRCGADCVEIHSAARQPLQLFVGAVALRIDGDVRLDFGVPAAPTRRRESMDRNQVSHFLAARAAVPMFTIAVLGGSAVVEAQQRLELHAGETRSVSQPVAPTVADLDAVRALWPAVIATDADATERFAALAYRLRVQPALYAAVRADLQRLVGDASASDEVQARALQLLVFDPAGDSLDLAARQPSDDPDVLLRLSERGVAAARRALRVSIAAAEPDDGELYAVAAHLAANSKPPSPRLATLLRAAFGHEHGLEPPVLVRVMVAALGLRALGDGEPLRDLWRDLGAAVDEALAADAIEDAAHMVAIADWLLANGVDGSAGSLAWLRDDFLATWAQQQFERELGDPARIRARLAAITPR